ncbi:MBL fold metallo-hydrolase [Herbiconiux moechotypicola]|uniref:MBL fold metallo-hydrolase n=1 Tax=Herbiconiux moechotypicola TaxID=637393 RepID=A0ABN3DLL9_9MICO|nr:MBL fold metallo-hydrolase [Herbiconiux moechotypicola]MCS5730142.1 MBL fold metallo-hydrolase [Herbiconiux moechotypicola]
MIAARDWDEVGAGVFHRRYQPVDVSVVAVVGPSGVTVVDTRKNPAEAREIVDDVDAAFGLPVVAAVNTHAHYDHTFGNQVFVGLGVPVYGHAGIAAHFERFEGPRLAAVQADAQREPDKDWGEVVLTVPTVVVPGVAGGAMRIAPGGRPIDLVPLPPGHTDTDLAVHVPDAGVWALGDVIEQSGPPMFGSGSYPLGWGGALRALAPRIRSDEVIVPGHGEPVDLGFLMRQAERFDEVARMIVRAWETRTAVDEVQLPGGLLEVWPDWMLRSALRAGFAQLLSPERSGR